MRDLLQKTPAHLRLILAAALFVSIVTSAYNAWAECANAGGPVADSPCDCAYMESLEGRAWMEAEREIQQNQNLIFKADSVLQYTCFDSYARVNALFAAPLFSENDYWFPIHDEEHTDRALQQVVGDALQSYLDLNFDHDYLGGRMNGEAYDVETIIGGGDYLCDVMGTVYDFAKCYNFMTIPDQDGFFSFEEYAAGTEPRQLPEPCEPDDRWADFLDAALADPPWYPDFEDTTNEAFTNIAAKLAPGACGAAIPTGLPILGGGNDAVCPNPGCSYTGGGCAP